MKKSFLFILIFISTYAYSQERPTVLLEPYLDLKLTEAERDSLLGDLEGMKAQLTALHKYTLTNDVMPAILFDPLPAGFSQKKRPETTNFDLSETALPANRDDLAFYTIEQLSYLIRNNRISSLELTRFFIDRFKQYSDTLQNTVSLLEESAIRQAIKADEEIKAGIYRGPLHGIPYGVKDLLSVEGTKTTWGAMPYKDQKIETTATIVNKLNDAGAVLVAKLTLGALAMGDIWYGGVTKNPWNLEQGSSGSSAGSAASVAAGLIPFAIGTETLGSIVSPSTRCGTTGLRPTYGRVSRHGAMALSWSMDKIGPMAKSAKDCAIVFGVIEGKDPNDPSTIAMDFSYQPLKDLSNIRIGYLADLFDRDYNNKEQDRQTLDMLVKLGAKLEPVTLPDSFPMNAFYMILMSEAAAAFDQLTREDLDDLLVNQRKNAWPNYFRAARFIPAVDYINANRVRRQLQNTLHDLFNEYDVIISPTFGGHQLMMTNLTSHPAVVVPNGFTEKGTPTSITFLGNLFDEGMILSVAQLYQENTDFDDQHPPLFK